jgi:hypothetical protein
MQSRTCVLREEKLTLYLQVDQNGVAANYVEKLHCILDEKDAMTKALRQHLATYKIKNWFLDSYGLMAREALAQSCHFRFEIGGRNQKGLPAHGILNALFSRLI